MKQGNIVSLLSRAMLAGSLLIMLAVVALAQQPAVAPAPPSAAEAAAVIPPQGEPAKPAKNMLSVFYDGGICMYPLAACSFILLVFVFERFVSLRRGRVVPRPFIKRFIEQLREGQLDREKAVKLCQGDGSPAATVFAAAAKKWGRTSVEVEQAILDTGERVANQLRRHLRLFNGIAQVAPLLGLLGTVIGMILSFNSIAGAQEGQREMMAVGIGQALISTAAGMLVAIPALLAYLFFQSRVDSLITEIDGLGQQVVELIAGDTSEPRQSRKAKAAA